MATPRVKHLLSALIAIPAAILACGGYYYEAPPKLGNYPERLPGKTLREIMKESNPPAADYATFDQLQAEVSAIANDLTTASREDLEKRIETTLQRNRTGDYRKRFANCLLDFQDLLQGKDIPSAEIVEYAKWRLGAMAWDDGFFIWPPSEKGWDELPDDKLSAESKVKKKAMNETAARLAKEITKASPALKPHWQIQAGAWQLKHMNFKAAEEQFHYINILSAGSPRAEVATLMIARTRMEEWWTARIYSQRRGDRQSPGNYPVQFSAAVDAFKAYLTAYPNGRFAMDIDGWIGGLHLENNEPQTAIISFLKQMDHTGHPEIIRSGVEGFDRSLQVIIPKFTIEDADFYYWEIGVLTEIAKHPAAALAFVYRFLDYQSGKDVRSYTSRETYVNNKYLKPVAKVRREGRTLIPQLATALTQENGRSGKSTWTPAELAVFAWAVTECGDHEQAVRICDLAGDTLKESDDLIFVRAVARQRSGKYQNSITDYLLLREMFPKSSLIRECDFRLATCYKDINERGLAAVEFLRILIHQELVPIPDNDGDESQDQETNPSLHLTAEISQWVETLLQFSSLPELERGLAAENLEPNIANKLRKILRNRYLAKEDFKSALRLIRQIETPYSMLSFDEKWSEVEGWEGDELEGVIKDLREQTRLSHKPASKAKKAERLFALAETWVSTRGYLTLPSVTEFDLHNATFAGFPRQNSATELESRDELKHAFRYYMEAADINPKGPLAAKALVQANDTLRRMAEISSWSAGRAFETDTDKLSRQIHERLKKDHPASHEAKQLSVWWTFPLPTNHQLKPGPYYDYAEEVEVGDAISGNSSEKPTIQTPNQITFASLKKRLWKLGDNSLILSNQELLDELESIRKDLRPIITSAWESDLINHLDDLTLFLHEPNLTPSIRMNYFRIRLSNESPVINNPETQQWIDYLTFLALVRDRLPGKSSAQSMCLQMQKFLDEFPQSKKREAAMARLAIATVRANHGHTGGERTVWPESPIRSGYMTIKPSSQTVFDAKAVFDALDAYEKEFPAGRYAAEMRLWRGVASIDTKDWITAVNLLTATLDDQTKRDLHLDAALNLADIYFRLLDEPESRQAIIAALRTNDSAQKRLKLFYQSNTIGARLNCLSGYLDACFQKAPDNTAMLR